MKSPIVVAVAAFCVAACSNQDAPSEEAGSAAMTPVAPAEQIGEPATEANQGGSSSVDEYASPAADAPAPAAEPPIDPDNPGGPQIDQPRQ